VRASTRRSKPQTGADSAIGKLAAAREQREARAAKQQQEAKEKEERGRGYGSDADWDGEAELSSEEAASDDDGLFDDGLTAKREAYDGASDDEVGCCIGLNSELELVQLMFGVVLGVCCGPCVVAGACCRMGRRHIVMITNSEVVAWLSSHGLFDRLPSSCRHDGLAVTPSCGCHRTM